MRLKLALDDKKFDVRMIDQLVADGKITKDEYLKFLATLPEEKDNYSIYDPAHAGITTKLPDGSGNAYNDDDELMEH
ncbi:MAG: hypothetical protein U0T83_01690 [Bacteriovoracaceae bacterium]